MYSMACILVAMDHFRALNHCKGVLYSSWVPSTQKRYRHHQGLLHPNMVETLMLVVKTASRAAKRPLRSK